METVLGAKESGSSMFEAQSPAPKKGSSMGAAAAQVALRAMAFGLALSAACLILTSKQSIDILGIQFTAHYHYSSAFKFLLASDIAACPLALVSLLFFYTFNHSNAKPEYHFFLFLHDLVVMVLVMAGSAAATAVGYIAKYGQEQSGWVPICNQVGKFCHKMFASVMLSYLAFTCFFLLTILSANNLKYARSTI